MADTDTTTTTEDTSTDTPADTQTDTESQDTTDWKAMARKHERDAKRLRKEADDLRAANQTAEEKALEEARAAGRSEAETELGTQVMTLRMENAILRSDAAKRLADPSDALVFLSADDVIDDGEVDPKALVKAIDALLERKPHLAAGSPTPTVPGGPRNQGEPAADDMNTRLRRAAGRA